MQNTTLPSVITENKPALATLELAPKNEISKAYISGLVVRTLANPDLIDAIGMIVAQAFALKNIQTTEEEVAYIVEKLTNHIKRKYKHLTDKEIELAVTHGITEEYGKPMYGVSFASLAVCLKDYEQARQRHIAELKRQEYKAAQVESERAYKLVMKNEKEEKAAICNKFFYHLNKAQQKSFLEKKAQNQIEWINAIDKLYKLKNVRFSNMNLVIDFVFSNETLKPLLDHPKKLLAQPHLYHKDKKLSKTTRELNNFSIWFKMMSEPEIK